MHTTTPTSHRAPGFILGLAGMVALAITAAASAQWSDNPMVNTPIGVQANQQAQPKILPTADGGAYVSWFGGIGYDVWLQRFDAEGNAIWKQPLLVADRGFSSTQDYGLSIDTAGYALLAFRDDRFGGTQITAARIAPDATLVWGAGGVQLTAGGDFVAAPKIAGTADGHIVVGWTNNSNVHLVKLDADGEDVWGPEVLSDAPGTANLSLSDLKASDDPDALPGSVVAMWVRQQGPTGARHLYARAYSPDGIILWDHGAIFDSGSLQFGNFPSFVPDGLGGMVVAWYTTSPLQCWVQRVMIDGNAAYQAGGVPLSTNTTTRVRSAPSVAYNTQSGEAYVFWRETNSTQSSYGVWGQKLDPQGARQWGDEGLTVVPLGANDVGQVRTTIMNEGEAGATACFVETLAFGNQRVRAARFDGDGNAVWSPTFTEASTVTSAKSRLDAAISADGFAMLVWQDERNDSGDIFGQNVNADGSLGIADPTTPGDLNADGVVNVFDMLILLGEWGDCADPGNCPADLNGDGTVNVFDLLILLGNWG